MIRKLTMQDVPDYRRIFKDCVYDHIHLGLEKEHELEVKKNLISKASSVKAIDNILSGMSFVYEERNSVKGFCLFEENAIMMLFIDPNLHKSGYGSRLLSFMEGSILKSGYDEALVHAIHGSLSFYYKKGYTMHDGRTHIPELLNPDYSCIPLKKDLTSIIS